MSSRFRPSISTEKKKLSHTHTPKLFFSMIRKTNLHKSNSGVRLFRLYISIRRERKSGEGKRRVYEYFDLKKTNINSYLFRFQIWLKKKSDENMFMCVC